MLDIKRLYYFVTIVNENSVVNASKKLYVSQPALSKQIKILEDEIGIKLFIRKSNKLYLTEEGKYLYDKSLEVLSLVNNIQENINNDKEVKGTINIGAAETKGIDIIAQSFKELKIKYNDIKLNLISGNASFILDELDKGIIDFAIVIEPVLKKDNYEYFKLSHTEIWGLLTKKDGIFKNKNYIQKKDLVDIPIFTSFQDFHSTILNEWIGDTNQKFNIIGHYNLINNIVHFVNNDAGHVLCLKNIVNLENTNLKFLPLDPQICSDLSIIWKKDTQMSLVSKKFLEILKNI